MMLIDPHGDLAERVVRAVPAHRRKDVIYFNVPDPTQPFGYNPLRHVREDKITLAASGLLEAFKKMWPDAWGARMEHVLRNSLLTLRCRRCGRCDCAGKLASPESGGRDAVTCTWRPSTGRCRYQVSAARRESVARPTAGCRG